MIESDLSHDNIHSNRSRYVSCIFRDPFDGPTPEAAVLRCVTSLLDAGCYEVSLGDTLGVGSPSNVHTLIQYLTSHGVPIDKLAGHFHDTYGQAVANVWEAYTCGMRVFDSSVGGLGGCPFAPVQRATSPLKIWYTCSTTQVSARAWIWPS